jgi:hypothetical protein
VDRDSQQQCVSGTGRLQDRRALAEHHTR